MSLPLCDLFPRYRAFNRNPFGHNAEVGLNLEKLFQNQRLGLADGFLHCQDANNMIANPQVVAFCFDIRVRYLVIEELAALRTAFNTPSVVIEQPAEKAEAVVAQKRLNLYEVGQLSHEAPDTLLKTE